MDPGCRPSWIDPTRSGAKQASGRSCPVWRWHKPSSLANSRVDPTSPDSRRRRHSRATQSARTGARSGVASEVGALPATESRTRLCGVRALSGRQSRLRRRPPRLACQTGKLPLDPTNDLRRPEDNLVKRSADPRGRVIFWSPPPLPQYSQDLLDNQGVQDTRAHARQGADFAKVTGPAGGDPSGGDDVRPLPAVAAQRRGPAVRAEHRDLP